MLYFSPDFLPVFDCNAAKRNCLLLSFFIIKETVPLHKLQTPSNKTSGRSFISFFLTTNRYLLRAFYLFVLKSAINPWVSQLATACRLSAITNRFWSRVW